MADVVELDRRRPHITERMWCDDCARYFVSIHLDIARDRWECPTCKTMTAMPAEALYMLRNEKRCLRKRRYLGISSANATVFRRQKQEKGSKFEAYECPYCKWWHIATVRPAEKTTGDRE